MILEKDCHIVDCYAVNTLIGREYFNPMDVMYLEANFADAHLDYHNDVLQEWWNVKPGHKTTLEDVLKHCPCSNSEKHQSAFITEINHN